ncbi:MAG: hypothetical protein WBP64_20950 [Nitrososphaeraceae archaeon]
MKEREVKEFEWYLRDHFFRQSNLNKQRFFSKQLSMDMVNNYLRYRNSDPVELNEFVDAVLENLLARQVISEMMPNGSFELMHKLFRLQCAKCYYISYLNHNEPNECLRCSSTELHDFPKKNK